MLGRHIGETRRVALKRTRRPRRVGRETRMRCYRDPVSANLIPDRRDDPHVSIYAEDVFTAKFAPVVEQYRPPLRGCLRPSPASRQDQELRLTGEEVMQYVGRERFGVSFKDRPRDYADEGYEWTAGHLFSNRARFAATSKGLLSAGASSSRRSPCHKWMHSPDTRREGHRCSQRKVRSESS